MRVFANPEIKDSFHMIHFSIVKLFSVVIQVDYLFGFVSDLKILSFCLL